MSATLQHLPQPTLPQMSISGSAAMAPGPSTPKLSTATTFMSSSPYRNDCRHRLPEQRTSLWHPVPSNGRDLDYHRGGPQASGSRNRLLPAFHTWGQTSFHPHLHFVVPGGGFREMERGGSPAAPGFFVPVRCSPACFAACFWNPCRRHSTPESCNSSSASGTPSPTGGLRPVCGPSEGLDWVVYAKRPFAGPSKFSTTSAAIPTGSQSPTIVCSTSKTVTSAFNGRITGTAIRSKR